MGEVSVNKFVNSIMNDYDFNRNGKIDLDKDETYFDQDQTTQEGNMMYRTVTRFSYNDLFVKSDANNDGKVTKEEITDVVNKYDTDKNGTLSARGFWDWLTGKPEGELDVFNREVPERSRIIAKYPIGTVPNIPNPPIPQNPVFPHNV